MALSLQPLALFAKSSSFKDLEKSSRVETLKELRTTRTIADLSQQVEKIVSADDFRLFQIEAQNVLSTAVRYEVESNQVVNVLVGDQRVPVRFEEENKSEEGFRFSVNHRRLTYKHSDNLDVLISQIEKALPKATAQNHSLFISHAHAVEPVTVAVVLAVVGLVILVSYGLDCAYLHYYQVKCAFPNQSQEELRAWADDFLLRSPKTQNCKARKAVEKCLREKGAFDRSQTPRSSRGQTRSGAK